MWELDCEEGWALNNRCFWTVVLEKTLESPLDCKEVQPVHSKGDQSWMFFGRNDAKAEAPVLWSPHAKSWLTGKTIALTRTTFVGKVMSLLLNMLSRLVITFLPRSKGLLISWLQSKSAVLNILCRPLLLPPSIFPSIKVFSNESVLHIRWPKYWSFSFSVSPSNEHSGLISFRMGWFDLLAVQGTLKSLLQHHSSKASILQHSAFFIVRL